MTNLSHLNALELHLSHEREYLRAAKSTQETELRKVWIAQIEKEIASERKFLGLEDAATVEMTDDELLAQLNA